MATLPNNLAEQATLVKQQKAGASAEAGGEPGKSLGRYQILQTLGQGGMGAVYLAFDPLLQRKVAIKTPIFGSDREAALARFLRESQVIASLHHPAICPVYDFGMVGATPFLCMPYLSGVPLSHRLVPGMAAGVPFSARLTRQVALAMQYVHEQGIVHRDLKPANIMLNERDEPILMDFGLARSMNLSSLQLTSQGDIMGTPAYMSPEQVNGEQERIGPACDIYSLGVILYVMLTGRTPYTGDSLTMMMQIVSDPPTPPSQLAPGLDTAWDAICLKAMEKQPADRWASMQELAAALEPLQSTSSARPRSVPRVKSSARLTLRIEGTTFAYRPPPSVQVITVGRQKRKPGDAVNQGNDLVLRVEGNDALSARISRRHFEIHHDGQGNYSLVDISKAGVTINGRVAVKGEPEPLQQGDVLQVAGVVTLTVHLEEPQDWQAVRPGAVVQAPALPGQAAHQFMMEASVGELGTIEGDAP